jgi:amidohydrolase
MIERAQQMQDQLSAWRRDLHMYPEVGFQERRTGARVAEILASLGYRVRTGVGRTGVVGDLGQGGPIIAIRADIDALPLQEENAVPYASQIPGVMHACGHDGNTAIALGAAALLARETFHGTVRFLFQPSEETEDEEGLSGAPRMIEDGAMEDVCAVLGQHVNSRLPVGDVVLGAGASSAGIDNFYLTISGKGGHAGMPHLAVDPVYIAGHVILALKGLTARCLSPFETGVVSIGSIHAGQAENIIPDQVRMVGNIRYMEPKVADKIRAEFERAVQVARALGGDYELEIRTTTWPGVNDEGVVALIRKAAAEVVGEEHIQPREPMLGGEDFGLLLKKAPGAMFGTGCRIEGDERQHHNPRFDLDERGLPIGAAILALAACQYLKENASPSLSPC